MKGNYRICRRCGCKYFSSELDINFICEECIKDKELYNKFIGV